LGPPNQEAEIRRLFALGRIDPCYRVCRPHLLLTAFITLRHILLDGSRGCCCPHVVALDRTRDQPSERIDIYDLVASCLHDICKVFPYL